MKGLRTLFVNAAIVATVAVLQFIVGADLSAVVKPEIALVIVALANIGLRLITTTPVGKK